MKARLLYVLLFFPIMSFAYEYDIQICKGYIDEKKLDPDLFIPESQYTIEKASEALEFFEKETFDRLSKITVPGNMFEDIGFAIKYNNSRVLLRGFILKTDYESKLYKYLATGKGSENEVETAKKTFCNYLEKEGFYGD